MSYPAIAGHGLIGDLQSAALVATDGTVDWFCCPRFDSPSVFASVAEVLDFMPIKDPQVATDRRRLVRVVIGVRGEIELEARIEPRFDYGRRSHTAHVTGSNARFDSGTLTLRLASTWPVRRAGRRSGRVRAPPEQRRTTSSSAAERCRSSCATRRPSGVDGSSAVPTAGAGGSQSNARRSR